MRWKRTVPPARQADLGTCTAQVKGPMGLGLEITGRDYAAGLADE